MTSYKKLGVRPVINAYATVTKYGGSLMPPEVLTAMTAAANSFVDLAALQRAVGARIAELTRNEAAYVTSGAAAGVLLAAAACVLRKCPEAAKTFPQLDGMPHEAIVQRHHRNGYDFGVQAIGLRFIEIEPCLDSLRAAINERTACIFWFAGTMNTPDEIPLPQLIKVAEAQDLPVIVDAAAQLPPVDNLWRYTQMGAALALFSGGKDLRGPQPTGLMLGRRELIECIRPISSPNHGLGRPLKVGKEELMGVLAAVERYLGLDHAARATYCEDCVALWLAALNPLAGVAAERAFPNEANQPLPWCRVTIDAVALGMSADAVVQAFLAQEPAIAVSPFSDTQFHLNPMTLNRGEEIIVRDACLRVLGGS